MTSIDRDLSFEHTRVLPPDVVVDRQPDGTLRAVSPHALGPYPPRLTDRLEHWARVAPDRPFLAERGPDGAWQLETYTSIFNRVRSVAQAFLDRQLSPDRSVVILSGNSIDHAVVALAAMFCGVPYAPVAPAYSLRVNDHATLRHVLGRMAPGLVFAADGPAFEATLGDTIPDDVEVVTRVPITTTRTTTLAALEATGPTPAVDAAHAQVNGDTVAKILFTSGSTGRPKGVINTQRMLCANQEQLRTVLAFLADAPPVLCDWLPWNHTFGGNHNFGIALYNGGTLYLDDGRPGPGAMDRTIANLRDVATTAYFNVPRGFEMLLPVLREDEQFRLHFFSRLQALFFAAAGLRPDVADGMQELAIATTGRPIPWITGLGATESAPFALCTGARLSTTTDVGVPVPGLELKIVPVDELLEARLRGPNVTPGYWRDPELTRAAFDAEGFYRMGDALLPVDADDLTRGFLFHTRLNEDFKLSTGTWVRVGAVRARLLGALGDIAQDVVIAGHGRDGVSALIFPNALTCRALAGARASEPFAQVLGHESVRRSFRDRLAAYNGQNIGGSTGIQHALVLETPPSLEAMEITDKGSVNQRAVLAARASLVEMLYSADARDVLL